MPKNKFQEVIFTIIMVFVMVYAMICYNIVLNTGTMTNETFLLAFHELTFMGPIAFILDFFIIGGLAKKIAFGIVDMRRDNPFHLVLAISAVSVAFMCPCMSFSRTSEPRSTIGEEIRKEKVTPSGRPALVKPINRGMEEQEQKGVTVPRSAEIIFAPIP